MDYLITDKWRLHQSDSLNLELEEWRFPEDRPSNKDKEKQEKWMGTGHYFQNVHSALIWMLDHHMVNDKGECRNLKEAVQKMQHIANELKQVRVSE